MEKPAQNLVSKAHYKTKAKDYEAPLSCNCVTAVRYLFAQTTKVLIPHAWIGNLPRGLSSLGWKCLKVKHSDLQSGDVIFLKNRRSVHKITHMAVALSPNLFFHCTSKKAVRGCEIVNCKSLHRRYEMVSYSSMRYEDYRTTSRSFAKATVSIPRSPGTLFLENWELLKLASLTKDENRFTLMIVAFSLGFFDRVPNELLLLQLSNK